MKKWLFLLLLICSVAAFYAGLNIRKVDLEKSWKTKTTVVGNEVVVAMKPHGKAGNFTRPVARGADGPEKHERTISTSNADKPVFTGLADASLWPKEYEVHVVAGSRPDPKNGHNRVKVVVDRPEKDVVVILCAGDNVIWELVPTHGTRIFQIVLGCSREHGLKTEAKAAVTYQPLPAAFMKGYVGYQGLLEYVAKTFGKKRVNSYSGKWRLPPRVVVDKSDDANPTLSVEYPPVEKSPYELTFPLQGKGGPEQWSPSGPLQGAGSPVLRQVRRVDVGRYAYFIGKGKQLVIEDLETTKREKYPLPALPYRMTNPQCIAYSSENEMLMLSGLSNVSNERLILRFGVRIRDWLGQSPQGEFLADYLVYDPYAKRFIGLDGDEKALVFQASGKLESCTKLIRLLKGTKRCPGEIMAVVPKKECLVFLKMTQKDGSHTDGTAVVDRIWVVERDFSRAFLTYKR